MQTKNLHPTSLWLTYMGLQRCQLILSIATFFACYCGNSDADSIGHGGTYPHFYKWLDTGGCTVNRRTANKKLTKLYWPSRKRSPKRAKKWRAIRDGQVPPLSNSFRRHWVYSVNLESLQTKGSKLQTPDYVLSTVHIVRLALIMAQCR